MRSAFCESRAAAANSPIGTRSSISVTIAPAPGTESSPDRERGQALADRRRELEAVARARRADDDAAAPLEDERLVRGRRVHARLRTDRVGVGEPVSLASPGRDSLDQFRLRLARHV